MESAEAKIANYAFKCGMEEAAHIIILTSLRKDMHNSPHVLEIVKTVLTATAQIIHKHAQSTANERFPCLPLISTNPTTTPSS